MIDYMNAVGHRLFQANGANSGLVAFLQDNAYTVSTNHNYTVRWTENNLLPSTEAVRENLNAAALQDPWKRMQFRGYFILLGQESGEEFSGFRLAVL
jgi:hypothetical protein